MKNLLLIAALATVSSAAPLAWAEQAHHPDQDKKPATVMTDADKQMHMGKMQENMLRMHEQMHKIMNAKNPQEREQLLQEHSRMMQDGMRMMRDMKGSHGKMDGGKKDK